MIWWEKWQSYPVLERTPISISIISFGGIPNSRNVLFLQIFLKCAAKRSAENTSACSKASQTFSGTFSLPDLLRNLLWSPVEPGLALNQSLPDLLRNLLRNPVEPDLALHQSLPDLLQNLLQNPVEPDLALHQSLPDLLQNLLQNPVVHQSPGTFSGSFSGTSLNLTRRLHQCTSELFWAEDPISLRCWGKIGIGIILPGGLENKT